jgi:hypothetical protein
VSIYIVTWKLKNRNSGARKEGRCYVATDKHVSLAMDTQATIEELLEVVFSMRSVLRLHSKNNRGKLWS